MRNTTLSLSLLITIAFLSPFYSLAQLDTYENLEQVGQRGFFQTYFVDDFKGFRGVQDPFSLCGEIGLDMRSYKAYNGDARQDPMFYTFNTNLNFKIFRVDVPFSMLVTAKNRDSSLPSFKEIGDAFKDNTTAQKDRFVRFGVSPQYKWVKFHFGHRNMNFSKYTLDDLNFLGAGTELTPGNWRVAAMTGRLAKAEPVDLSLTTPNIPVYERKGWGAKLGYGNEDNSVDLIAFKAEDDINSIDIPIDHEEQVSPQDNLTLGLNLQTLLYQRFRLRGEFALSALSPNSLDAMRSSSDYPSFLFQERMTSESSKAIDIALDYEGAAFVAGVQAIRVDPNYSSFGAYFFNNDILDLLGNVRFAFFEDQLNFALSGGVQTNNIEDTDPTTTDRLIYSADIGFANEDLSINTNYSNNTTKIGYVLNKNLDSLNAVIVVQNAGIIGTYFLPGEGDNLQSISLMGNVQEVSDDIEINPRNTTSQLILGNLIYNLTFFNSGWNFSARANYSQNELSQFLTKRYGGGFGVSKSFNEGRLNTGFETNYFINSSDDVDNTSNLIGHLTCSYVIANGLSTNFSIGVLNTTLGSGLDPFTELTGNLGFNYAFNIGAVEQIDETISEQVDGEVYEEEVVDSEEINEEVVEEVLEEVMEETIEEEIVEEEIVSEEIELTDQQQLLEQQKLAEQEAERIRLEEEQKAIELAALEQQRIAEEAAEKTRLEEEQKANEMARLEEQRIAAENSERERIEAEQQAAALAKAELEKQNRIEQEKLEQERKLAEQESIVPINESVNDAGATYQTSYVIATTTNLRPESTHAAPSLKRLLPGSVVILIDQDSDKWWQVSSDGQVGFIKVSSLDLNSGSKVIPVESQNLISLGKYTVTEATSLRYASTHLSGVIRRLQPGETVNVLEKTSVDWWKVQQSDKIGYVKARLLTQ